MLLDQTSRAVHSFFHHPHPLRATNAFIHSSFKACNVLCECERTWQFGLDPAKAWHYKIKTFHSSNALQWRQRVSRISHTTQPGLGAKLKASMLQFGKRGETILPSQASLNPFRLTPIIICLMHNQKFSKRPQELPCRGAGVSHSKGVPTAMQADFASISCHAHPPGDMGNIT